MCLIQIKNLHVFFIVFGKPECRGMNIYLRPRLPSESMHVPVYMCVFKFFSETTGPTEPNFMWNHNRIGKESFT